MNSFKEEFVRLKELGSYIRFKDTTCRRDEDITEGKVVEVGENCAIIETNDGARLYNIRNIVWLQVLG